MAVKIGTGLVLAVLALAGILWAPFWLVAPLATIVVIGAHYEFLRLSGGALSSGDIGVALAGCAAVLAAAALSPWKDVLAWMATATMLATLTMLFRVLITPLRRPEDMPRAAMRSLWMIGGLVYVGLLGSGWLVLMRDAMGGQGRGLVLLAAFVTWMNDTFAYFGGKTMGRHRMYPAVSPNKTWEGSGWGMVGSIAGALGVRAVLLPEAPLWSVLAFAITGGALAQAGDLVESIFKRAADVKDSASFLPGHGGFLDRIDAFLFVLPWTLAWFLLWWPLPPR